MKISCHLFLFSAFSGRTSRCHDGIGVCHSVDIQARSTHFGATSHTSQTMRLSICRRIFDCLSAMSQRPADRHVCSFFDFLEISQLSTEGGWSYFTKFGYIALNAMTAVTVAAICLHSKIPCKLHVLLCHFYIYTSLHVDLNAHSHVFKHWSECHCFKAPV